MVYRRTQTSRCYREQRRSLFIWSAGVSTSPLQLLAYRGLLPLKGFWVYVRAYGITLSSVLTAKHDSTANFWPEIKPQQNDKKQTSNLLGYYQTGAAGAVDEGNKVIGKKRKRLLHYTTMRNGFAPLFASFHFITTFTAFIPFKGTQSYSKSG